MLKKFSLFIACLSLCGCFSTKGPEISSSGGAKAINTDISEINLSQDGRGFRVGVLLPLTGQASKQGQGLRNATMLALEDVRNPNLILQYYDTKSTPSGARVAVENAIRQRSDMIIGPLMSTEVQAIANETIYQGVPVIAFSTAQDVLQPTVYTLGLLVEEQVNRIMTYAAQKGKKRFALLIPDNMTGSAVAKAAVKSAQKNNVNVTAIAFYPPETSDFSEIIKEMTNHRVRKQRLNALKASLQKQADAGNASATKALQRLKTKEGLGDIGFDAVLIPETGAKLTSAISMFAYYDVAYPQVQFLGTSVWENGHYNKESMIVRSWYPALSRSYSNYFSNKYNQLFGEKPSSLYSFAYDAVALANELSKQNPDNINKAITNPDGYAGINGSFRLFENGTNQHSLDVVEIRREGDVVIDTASRSFVDSGSDQLLSAVEIDSTYQAPAIYGKDPSTAQILIYGEVLPIENQAPSKLTTEEEQKAVYDELRQMNIIIP